MPKLDRRTITALPGPEDERFDVIHWDDDMPGLGLRVLRSGARSWIVRYRIGKRQRNVSLGKASALSPTKAREEAAKILAKAKLGHDARHEINERRAAGSAPKTRTLGDLVELYERYVVVGQKPRTQLETKRHLEKHWAPLRPLPVAGVGRKEVAARLLVLRDESGVVAANRARSTLSALFSWAIQQGMADVNPVVGTRKNPEASRERTLTSDELKAVWAATAEAGDHNVIVRLLLLTGQRRQEVAAMRWSEIDLDQGVWGLPANRTKNGRGHRIPLSRLAIAVLGSCPRLDGRDLLFGQGSGPFSGWSRAKQRLDQRCGVTGWTLHDLRRTLVTGMNDLGVLPHVVEAVVNHFSGVARRGVAGVYNHAQYSADKRRALDLWAEHVMQVVACEGPKAGSLRRLHSEAERAEEFA